MRPLAKKVKILIPLLALLFLPTLSLVPMAKAATVLSTVDCPGFSAIHSAASGNPGTGVSVSFSGTTSQTYSVTLPSLSDLLEYCVYPNGGDVSTITSPSTSCTDSGPTSSCPITVGGLNWHQFINCNNGVSGDSCAEARDNTGNDHVLGPQTSLSVFTVTYTAPPSTLLIALHVSDEGSGVCSTSGTADNPSTCFIIPSGGIFPPPPPPSVPQFPIGMSFVLMALVPALFLLRKRIVLSN